MKNKFSINKKLETLIIFQKLKWERVLTNPQAPTTEFNLAIGTSLVKMGMLMVPY